MNFLQYIAFLVLSFFITAPAWADVKPSNGAVVSAHPLATRAGQVILDQGGNAFDAAIAVSAAIAVVEPTGSSIGGGGFWLMYNAKQDRYFMIDARETAPSAATPNMYLNDVGDVIDGNSTNGPLAAGIPALPAAYDHITSLYGSMALSKTLKPAIDLAREGFPVDVRYVAGADFKQDLIRSFPETASIFLDDGDVPEEGWVLKQSDLANTLSMIASEGARSFYEGEFAKQMVQDVANNGGIWSLEDLTNYRIIERDPEIVTYNGAQFIMASLPSSGGLVMGQALKILEQFDLEAMAETERKHVIIEAMKASYEARAQYMGDPDFNDRDLGFLLSPDHIDKKVGAIRAEQTLKVEGDASDISEGDQTTHFAVIDKEGNRVAVTQSINLWFGSSFVPKGTGVILNNQMDDFVSKPGVPNQYGLVGGKVNAIEPNKRMLSSMTPTFVETDDKILMIGTPGGSRIITMNLLGALNWLDGMAIDNMVAAPRYHHQYLPNKVFYEDGAFSESEKEILSAKGHVLEQTNRRYGNMQVIEWDKSKNNISTASDPRGIGGDAHVY